MAISINVIIPALLSTSIIAYAVITLLKIYLNTRIKNIFIIFLGMLFQAFFFFKYIILEIFKGYQYEILTLILNWSIGTLGATGILIILFELRKLAALKMNLRMYALFTSTYFSWAIYLMTADFTYNAEFDIWNFNYTNPIGLILPAATGTWTVIEITIMAYKKYKNISSGYKYASKVFLLGWIAENFTGLGLVIERLVFKSNDSAYFMIVNAIAHILVIKALNLNPYMLISEKINPKYLIILDKSTDKTLLRVNFIETNEYSTNLFSQIMSAILLILEKTTKQQDLIKEFAFLNLSIIIEEIDNIIGFFVSEIQIEPIRLKLIDILKEFQEIEKNAEDPQYINFWNMKVKSYYKFAIQD